MKSLIFATVILMLSAPAFADGDVVTLRNGDRISGTIKKLDAGKWFGGQPGGAGFIGGLTGGVDPFLVFVSGVPGGIGNEEATFDI